MKKLLGIAASVLFLFGTAGAQQRVEVAATDQNNEVAGISSGGQPYAGNIAPGDTLYTFFIRSQIILGVCKMGSTNKLVFSSGGQSSVLLTDNKWIITDLYGNILDTTRLQIGGTSGQGFGFRDLAWDGQWILASDNNQIRRVDTATFTEILPRITSTVNTIHRGLAWSGPNEIWTANFTTGPVAMIDTTGVLRKTLGIPPVAPYGLATDKWTDATRMWLWYSQPSLAGQNRLSKVDTANGAIVQTFDYSAWLPTTATVGGMDIITDHPAYPGRVIGIVIIQNFPDSRVLVIDLGPNVTVTVPPLNPFSLQTPTPGITLTTLPGSTTPVVFSWDTSTALASYKWVFGAPTVPPRMLTIPTTTNSFATTLGRLDSILAAAGVAQGDSLVGQWNVWAFRNNPPQFDSLIAANGPRAITLKRGIPQLIPFSLVSPPTGTTIVTSPFNTATVRFVWRRSGAGVTYRWKFGSPTITTVRLNLASDGAGIDSALTRINSALDAILAGLGLNPGDSLNGQWAVWAYAAADSLRSSDVFNVTLKRQARGDVLVVYDSTAALGRVSRDSVVAVLSALGITFDLQNKGTTTAGPIFSMRGYKKVVWLGEATSTMTAAQRDSVKAYLNAGGTTPATKSKLIIFAEDIGWQHGRPGSANLDLDLVNNYLGFNYVADRPPTGALQGLIGVAINPGLADSTVGVWPEVMSPFGTGTANLYKFRRHPDSLNAIGKRATRWNTATLGVDVRSLRRAIDSPPGSPVFRMLTAAMDYVDEPPPAVHDIGVVAILQPPTEAAEGIAGLTPSHKGGYRDMPSDLTEKGGGAQYDAADKAPIAGEKNLITTADTVILGAVVRNFGTFIEPSYQVGWSINAVSQTPVSNTRPLPIDGRDTLSLPWPSPAPGTYLVKAWTILGTDTIRTNDTASITIVIVGVNDLQAGIPRTFELSQNYPNPFNPTTQIKYALPKESFVTLNVYNVLGQEVRPLVNTIQKAGYYDLVWDGRNRIGHTVGSGLYFYRIEAKPTDGSGAFVQVKKMLMIK